MNKLTDYFFKKIAKFALHNMKARDIGFLNESLKIKFAGQDPRIGGYALDYNNPQAIRFLIDVYPEFNKILLEFPRMGCVDFLDIGPAFGASAGLISEMHRSHFLGPKVNVEVLDITNEREDFIALNYPRINFINKKIEEIDEGINWDIVYCSNAIEHMEDPCDFIYNVLLRTRHKAIFLAPYLEEDPMSPGHISVISEATFNKFRISELKVFETEAWPVTSDGLQRRQIMAVLHGLNYNQ